MENNKHIFEFACDQDQQLKLYGSSPNNINKIKLLGKDNKEIKFCGPYFGSYSIFVKKEESKEEEFFKLFMHWASSDDCNWKDKGTYTPNSVDCKEVKVEVVLDNHCEYQIVLSAWNQRITLPRSSLFSQNLNLKKYYNKEIKLLKGEELREDVHARYYIPRIVYSKSGKEEEVCKLVGSSIPVCIRDDDSTKFCAVTPVDATLLFVDLSHYKLVIEKDEEGKLLVYLANSLEEPIDLNNEVIAMTEIYKQPLNVSLRSALLENSNIREVLSELEIDDNVNLVDIRQLKCWINRTSTIQKIASELVTERKDELGRAVLNATDSHDQNLATQVAGKVRLQNFVNVSAENLAEEIANKFTKEEMKEIVRETVNTITSQVRQQNNPDPEAFKKYERFAEKLAESLINKSEITKEQANNLVKDKVSDWGLAKYLLLHSGLKDRDKALELTKERVDREKLIEYLLEFAELTRDQAKTMVENINVENVVNQFFSTKSAELGQAVLEAKDDKGKEILVNNLDLQEGVAEKLRENPGETKGPKGDQGPQGLKGDPGQDGESPSINAVAAQLMSSHNKNTLVTEVAKNEDLQEAIAGSQVLRATIASLTKANNAQQNFTLQKGEKLLDDVYEANIVLNNKTMATLPKIGYYMLNDQLVVHNHVTKEEVAIPRDFHYLKVIKFGSGFSSGDYKLTFCNVFGNEFFEYKKYDPQYSNVSDEYKFISLNCAKKEYNPNLSDLFGHRPSFFIIEGPDEPGSPGHYQADVFELTNNNKGKKMATLIDEFGYFDQNGIFMHCNYHEETKCRSYTSAEIDKEYQVTDADSKFYLTEHDNVIIHIIPELI
ncbi:MAG: hypothetical protein LBJ80_05425 [Rickettsiales bacterium]|jgi:hypothetical protein|nr:hypothetical protein [Rickettsiales bacterium]MDR1261820.1 hypothetical protein [Rickettsiales bacterium]